MESTNAAGGQHIANIKLGALRGFLPAFAALLRTGIAIHAIDGVVDVGQQGLGLATNPHEDRLRLINDQIEAAKQDRDHALRQSRRFKGTAAEDVWGNEVLAYTQRLNSLTAALEAHVSTVPDSVPLEDVFSSNVTAILHATAAMAETSALHDRTLIQRSDNILINRRVEVLPDARIRMHTDVQLPINGGVGILGPVSWIPDQQPELLVGLLWTALEADNDDPPWLRQPSPENPGGLGLTTQGPIPWHAVNAPPATTTTARPSAHRRDGTSTPRTVLLDRHEDLGHALEDVGIPRLSISRLLNCPVPAAPWVVLADALGKSAPTWVGPEWANPVWMRWMHLFYASTGLADRSGMWAEPSWLRQSFIDVTLDAGDSITMHRIDEHLEAVGMQYKNLSSMLNPAWRVSQLGAGGVWNFPLDKYGPWPHSGQKPDRSTFGFTLYRCHCGAAGTTATRVTEIPGDLLCPHRHPVLAAKTLHRIAEEMAHAAEVRAEAAPPAAEPSQPAAAKTKSGRAAPLNVATQELLDLLAGLVVPHEYPWLHVPRHIWSVRRTGTRAATTFAPRSSVTKPIEDLSKQQLAVLTLLVRKRHSGEPAMSNPRIAAELDLSPMSTRAALGVLASHGFVRGDKADQAGQASLWSAVLPEDNA